LVKRNVSSEERKDNIDRTKSLNAFRYDSIGQTFVITEVEQILTNFFVLLPPIFEGRQILLRVSCCAHVQKN